ARAFLNTIEDYPYPYVIGRLCWEFPCVVPSDWEANHYDKPNNPITVQDWQAALDAIVLKQGVFTMVFHPHGWIKSEQIVDLIDYAIAKHGRKIKFLTFREAAERLKNNLLAGQPLRNEEGNDNGVRLLDVNNDGFLDVVVGNQKLAETRVWLPHIKKWATCEFPNVVTYKGKDFAAHFGVLREDGNATFFGGYGLVHYAGWHFDGRRWVRDDSLENGLENLVQTLTSPVSYVRLRDLDRDGRCELMVS